ncbi:MAG: T9SS type A sorting domain-containing protein [bacterium]
MKKAILLVFIFCTYIAFAQVEPIDTDGNGYRNISTLDHLRWISENDSSWSWNFELDNDIDASDTKNWYIGDHDSIPETPDVAMGWSPLGNYTLKFSGDFEGHDFKIDNLYSNRPKQNLVGFFGSIFYINLNKLSLTNCSIIGKNFVGGLVGLSRTSYIMNCDASGTISGNIYTGGLIGVTLFDSLDNCHSDCSVSGLNSIGGLVGVNQCYVSNCYSTGNVSGHTNVGGLFGDGTSTRVWLCYSTGSVIGVIYTGGLMGFASYAFINNCFALGDVQGGEYSGGLIGYVIGFGDLRASYSIGKVTGSTFVGGLVGYDDTDVITKCFWNIETSGIDSSDGGLGRTTAEMKNQSTYTDKGWNFKGIWKINPDVNGGYPIINNRLIGDIKGVEPKDPDGNGFYNVSTFSHLVWIGLNDNSLSRNFELDNDIKADSSYLINNDVGFTTIGRYGHRYYGKFKGNGFSIDSLYINQYYNYTLTDDKPVGGLFGYIGGKNCEISNLKLTNVNYETFTPCGGLVAVSNEASITNCSVDGQIFSGNYGGGLVGDMDYGLISDCNFIGKANANWSVGGIVGWCSNAVIRKCYSKGSFEGRNCGGRLIGVAKNCEINDSYSIGNVRAINYAGGLIGAIGNTKIDNCYSVGNVEGNYYIGAFIGNNDKGIVNNCFWDKDVCTIDSYKGGIPKTTSEMKTKSTFTDAGWDFDNIWNIDGVTNHGYPFLQVPGVSVKGFLNLESFSLSISPNPTSGKLNISYTLTEPALTSISISNMLGNEMAKISENQFQLTGKYNLNYNASNFAPGVYFITIKAGNKSETKKIGINY